MGVRVVAVRAAAICAVLASAVPSAARAYTVKHTDSGSVIRWSHPLVTLRIDPSVEEYFHHMSVRGVIRDAALAWRDLAGVPDVLINEGAPGPAGFAEGHANENGIYLVRDWQLATNALAVTVATYESASGKMVDTDILVNANHPFEVLSDGPDEPAQSYDLRGVLTHEMGHVLGLGESYDERMATMWPSIARGERHQRDIDWDDSSGVEDAYAGAKLSERTSSARGGCNGSSVLVGAARSSGQWAAVLVALGLLAGSVHLLRRRTLRPAGGLFFCGFALLFANPQAAAGGSEAANERVEVLRTLALRQLPPAQRQAGLSAAARSASAQVRVAAAAVLERAGSREDRALAARLAADLDPEVRRVGRAALAQLHSAPPLARVARDDPDAAARLAAFLHGARDLVSGEVVLRGARSQDGLIWSRYRLSGADGEHDLELPGGSLGAISQIVSEQEPPRDGDTLLVALHEAGPHAWAHLRDGVLYGGSLGEGPGIAWEP